MTAVFLCARLRLIAGSAAHLADVFDLSPELAPDDPGSRLALDDICAQLERIDRLTRLAAPRRAS